MVKVRSLLKLTCPFPFRNLQSFAKPNWYWYLYWYPFPSGGTFALYSLLCRHANFSLLPNQQAADEELSAYKYGPSSQIVASSPLKRFLDKHKTLRTALLVVVLFGACMVIGDGVLTPAISGNRLSMGNHQCFLPASLLLRGHNFKQTPTLTLMDTTCI